MKKLFLVPVAALLFAGCAKDVNVNTPVQEPDEVAPTSYLDINLSSGYVMRAQGETFQNGTNEENKVTMVRFYFFDAQGEAAKAWKLTGTGNNMYNSFIDWYPSDADFVDENNEKTVEKIGKTTLGLNVSEDERPASVLAVINPSKEILQLVETNNSLNGVSLSRLKSAIEDFKTGLTTSGTFVMSNSVYLDNTPRLCDTVGVINKFKTTAEDAATDPVTIYVERVLARLDLYIGIPADKTKTLADNVTKIYDVTKQGEDGYTVDDETGTKVYAKLLGWNITSTPNKSNLVKDISKDWTQAIIFGTSETLWNTNDYHRSFWGINPALLASDYLHGSFEGTDDANDHYPAMGQPIPPIKVEGSEDKQYATVYMQENAGESATSPAVAENKATKVIIAAQLVNEEGEKLELAEWGYKKYTLDNLKKYLAGSVLSSLWYDKNAGVDGASGKDMETIAPEDIDFKTQQQLEVDDASYYVYAVLSEDGEGKTWYLRGADGTFPDTPLTKELVNAELRDRINHVKVWNEGHTYYYFDIRHLSDTELTEEEKPMPGYVGVVRNHLYEAHVTGLSGLGTPVYKPDEIIIPETPEDDGSIVTATIKILQWRVVKQDYDIKWK